MMYQQFVHADYETFLHLIASVLMSFCYYVGLVFCEDTKPITYE
jgi:ABC-type multidrug transport system permease subunit